MSQWALLEGSDVTYGLSLSAGVTWANSILTCTNAVPLACAIVVSGAQQLRLTRESWNYAGVSSVIPDYWSWNADTVAEHNGDVTQATWIPGSFQAILNDGATLNFRAGDVSAPRSFAFLVEVLTNPGPEPISPIEDNGRASRAYVSAYNRTRIQVVRLIGNESRNLVADFNGAIPPNRTIVSAEWSLGLSGWLNMSNASITNGRQSSITIASMYTSSSAIRCAVTLDSGQILTQLFRILVSGVPIFQGDNFIFNGILTLTATYP